MTRLGWIVVGVLIAGLFGGLLIALDRADRACETVRHETGRTC